MVRIGRWFGRQPDTRWIVAEAEALAAISPINCSDIDLLEEYYQRDIPPPEDIRRRDLLTLLNNWAGEIDRARANPVSRRGETAETRTERAIREARERRERAQA